MIPSSCASSELAHSVTERNLREELAGASSGIDAKKSRLLLLPDRLARAARVDTHDVAVTLVKSYITAPRSLIGLSLDQRGGNRLESFGVGDVDRCRHSEAADCGEGGEKLGELHSDGDEVR